MIDVVRCGRISLTGACLVTVKSVQPFEDGIDPRLVAVRAVQVAAGTERCGMNDNGAGQGSPGTGKYVLCLNGSRIVNKRMAMFLECLQDDGFGVRVFSLPRHRWVLDKTERPLNVLKTTRTSAEIGDTSNSRLTAVFCFHWSVLPLAIVRGWLSRIPVVYDEHDHYEMNTLEGTGALFKVRLFSNVVRWIHRLCLPHVTLVTCIHQWRQTLLKHLQRWQPAVVEMHNYPSSIWRKTVRQPLVSDRLCFVYIGGVYVEKGCGAAAEAFLNLAPSLQQQAELHIFGEGDAALIESLRQRSGVAVHNGVTPEFFRTFASQRQCVGLAMLAGTPRYQLVGTNCTKLYEYFALGMPVIATNVGEFPDQISQNHVGLIIENDLNVQSLVSAMTHLLMNRDAVEQMSRNATTMMQRDEMTWEHEWSKVTRTGILHR